MRACLSMSVHRKLKEIRCEQESRPRVSMKILNTLLNPSLDP